MKQQQFLRGFVRAALFTAAVLSFFQVPARRVGSQGPASSEVITGLKSGAGFSDADLASLEKGEVVVRELSPADEREIAFAGAVKINAPRDVVFDAFRRAIEAQEKEIAISRGNFKRPPSARDLAKLEISDAEVRSLKSCEAGDCDWSLSGELIEKIKSEVDWDSGDAEARASDLFKEILAGYTADYLARGDEALMVYEDDPEPLDLKDEYRSLVGDLPWIDGLAPEFREYLKEFPRKRIEGVEDLVSWSNVRIGLKPVIVNTHTILYKKDDGALPLGFIVSKQIYANHYFHSSAALTAFASVPKGNGEFDTYVFFTSHSRTGALSGTLGQIARSAVDGQAESKLTSALKDTKRYTRYAVDGMTEAEESAEGGLFGWIFSVYSLIPITAGGIILFFAFRRRSGSKG